MRHIPPHSRLLTGFMFLLLVTTIEQPTRGQTEQARVSLTLTQLSPALPEVWPADVNSDGIPDLVAGNVAVQIGRGDGTFEPPQTVATNIGTVVGVGDLNRDGFIDIVTGSFALPGRGDGTFKPPIPLPAPVNAPTYVADMNNDGAPDLVFTSCANSCVAVAPGHGDFTFGANNNSPRAIILTGFTIADLNGDGLLDVAANDAVSRVNVFLNLGGFIFSLGTLPLPSSGLGITAGDMNGDGVVDLAVGFGREAATIWQDGFIDLFLGNGDGSFQTPVAYPVNNGPVVAVPSNVEPSSRWAV